MKMRNRAKRSTVMLAILLPVLILISLCIGRFDVPFSQVVRILLSRLFPSMEVTWTSAMASAVLYIRLPRILLACLVGCCLSAAGASYQGIFQNPMASPDLLGASAGASLGAALAILLGGNTLTITLFAFIASLLTILLVQLVAIRAPGKKTVSLILAGIMISSLVSAGTSCIKLVADPENQLPAITYWLMGSLSGAKAADILWALIPMGLGLIPLILLRWRVNLLTMGDDEAQTMGVNADRLRRSVIICSTLITAASVSLSGLIGWVGLVVPHLCRRTAGNDYRRLLPCSMLSGALFLLCADNIARNLFASEIPIGILTAFIGAPFFLVLFTGKENAL